MYVVRRDAGRVRLSLCVGHFGFADIFLFEVLVSELV